MVLARLPGDQEMRFFALFVVPYAVFSSVFAFGFHVVQNEESRIAQTQRSITALQVATCENQREVYHILSSGMRRRAVFADAYVTATGDKPYGRELRREADEIERISATIRDCRQR